MEITDQAPDAQPGDRVIRAAGALYLLLVVTGIFNLLAPQILVVPRDPTATAQKILASETLFRLAVLSGLIATIVFVFLARTLYRLLNRVNRWQASLMVILVLLSVPVSFLSALNQIAAPTLMHGGPALAALEPGQLNTLAMFFLGLSIDTNRLNSIFFGLWLFPFGLLVIKSGFIPQFLGYLLIIAGASYLAGTLAFLLSPTFARVISGVLAVGYAGELGVVVWLVVKAAKVQFGGATRSSR